jgi:hypothetical protein
VSSTSTPEGRTIVFEGFADTGAGWDFDMPVYMIRPVKREGIGGSMYYAEDMVEDCLGDLACGDEPESEDGEWGSVMRQFRTARAGSERFVYWRCEATVPGPDADDEEWDAVTPSPMHYGHPHP